MGIDVSATNVVTVNDQHENGVDTSAAGNPTRTRFKGIPVLHVLRRNTRGRRRDDGNPLVHALKGRKGFSIMPHWKGVVMARAQAILAAAAGDLQGFDFVMPMPSSSPFCAEFAALVAVAANAPILEPDFLRKRKVGEMLAEAKASPPSVGKRWRTALASQMHSWEGANPDATYQAKDVDVHLRQFFDAFTLDGDVPNLQDRRILVVDDVFATGSSLSAMRHTRGPARRAGFGGVLPQRPLGRHVLRTLTIRYVFHISTSSKWSDPRPCINLRVVKYQAGRQNPAGPR